MKLFFTFICIGMAAAGLIVCGAMTGRAIADDSVQNVLSFNENNTQAQSKTLGKHLSNAHNYLKLYMMISQLQNKVDRLTQALGIQKDIEEIRRLQHIYGYYMTNNLNHRVVDLFSDDAISAEFGGRGVYLGKEGVRTLFEKVHFGEIPDGPRFGLFIMFNQHMDVIDVDPDGQHAKARFRAFLLMGRYSAGAGWQAGDYENEYVKENGKWLFSKFAYKQIFTGGYDDFWSNPSWSSGPSELYPPDLPATAYHPFPENWIFPYHFPHPITDEWIPAFEPADDYWCGPTPCSMENNGSP